MTLSWRARAVITTETADTIADGVAGRFPIPEVLDDLLVVLADAVLVAEDSIKAGVRLLYQHGQFTAAGAIRSRPPGARPKRGGSRASSNGAPRGSASAWSRCPPTRA